MSKYTTEVRYICETAAGLTESAGFNSVDDIITAAAPKIFNFPWPIFDENYRLPLEIKILRHFYTREICEETVGLWKLRLQDKLQLIMPYYNKLYESELLSFNPLYDVDYTRSGSKNGDRSETASETGTRNGTYTADETATETGAASETDTTANTGSISNTSEKTDTGTVGNAGTENRTDTTEKTTEAWDLFSDTPQGSIQNVGITDNSYLSNARKNTNDTTDTLTVSGTTSNTETRDLNESESSTQTLNTNVSTEKNSEVTKNTEKESERTEEVSDVKSKSGRIESLDEYAEHIVGKTSGGSYSKMLMEFRETFLNIDKMIMQELQMLFFGLWD